MADLLHDAVILNNKVLCDPMLPFGMVATQSDFLAIRTRFAYFLQFCTSQIYTLLILDKHTLTFTCTLNVFLPDYARVLILANTGVRCVKSYPLPTRKIGNLNSNNESLTALTSPGNREI